MENLDNLMRYVAKLSDDELKEELDTTTFEAARAGNGLSIWISTAIEDAKKGLVFQVEGNLGRLIDRISEQYGNENPYKMIFRGIMDIAYTNGLVRLKESKSYDTKELRTYQIKRALLRVPDFEEDLKVIALSDYQGIVDYANTKIYEVEASTRRGRIKHILQKVNKRLR